MKQLTIMSALVANLFFNSCKTTPSDNAETKHQLGAYTPFMKTNLFTLSPGPYYWADITVEQYAKFAMHGIHQMLLGEVLSQDHKLTQHLNRWAGLVYNGIATTKELKTFIPKPKVIVFPSAEPNAFVTAVPVCLSAPLDVEFGAGPKEEDADTLMIDFMGARPLGFNPFTSTEEGCVDQPWSKDVDGFITWFNAVDGPCKLQRRGSGVILVDHEGCAARFKGHAKRFAFAASTSVVAIGSSMIETMKSEDETLAVFFHEMTHYLRAHPVVSYLPGLYGYFYEEKIPFPGGKPQAVTNTTQLANEGRPLHAPTAYNIPQARLDGRARKIYISLIQNSEVANCDVGIPCSRACKEVTQYISEPWFQEVMTGHRLSADIQRQYLAHESTLIECATSTVIGQNEAKNEIDRNVLLSMIDGSAYEFAKKLDLGATLGTALARISSTSRALDVQRAQFYARLQRQRLNIYSVEQEADDMSLEFSARGGLNPLIQASAIRNFMSSLPDEGFLENEGMTRAQCIEAMNQGWRSQIGNERALLPYQGWLPEAHRSLCYRSFNVFRENTTHGYRQNLSNRRIARLPNTEWSKYLAAVAPLTATAKAPIPSYIPQTPSGKRRRPPAIDENMIRRKRIE